MHPLARAACSPSTHASHAALTQPGRYQFPAPSTRVPIGRPVALTWPVHTFQVRAGDSRGCTRRFLALSVRAHRDGSNGTILEFASLRLFCRVSSRAFRTRCARPFSPPPFALTAAQPSPPAPPCACHVQPKHPCIACRTHPARAVPVPRPEHAHTHRPALSPSRGRCTRFRFGLATPSVREDLLRRDLYVRARIVSTVPCTSSVVAVCLSELLSAVMFSRVASVWPMVARVCYSSVYF